MNVLPDDLILKRYLYTLLKEKQRRELNIQLFEKQLEVEKCLEAGNNRLALEVGRRGGKTDYMCYKLSTECINNPKKKFAYIAKSQDSAKTIVWGKFKDMLEGFDGVKFIEGAYEIHFDNGSFVKCYGADKEPDVIRGTDYDGVAVDEAAFQKHLKYLLEEVVEPTLLDRNGWLIVSSSPKAFGQFYKYCHAPGTKYFHWTAYDNPHIPRSGLERIKEKYGENSPVWLQEYMAIPTRHAGLVFEAMQDKEPYVIDNVKVKESWQIVAGLDPGSKAPTGYSLCAYDPINDRVYVLKSWLKRVNLEEMARQIQKDLDMYTDMIIICDHHASIVIEELGARYKMPIFMSGKKDIHGSYSRAITRLERGKLSLVRGESEDLQTEMMSAEWKSSRSNPDGDATGVIGSDHCIDSLRYVNDYFFFKDGLKEPIKELLDEDPYEKILMKRLQQEKEEWGF